MKKHTNREPLNAKIRYHILGSDNLYTPIPFFFVSDRMCKEIAEERQLILDMMKTENAELARQHKLFGRYNPSHSAAAFNTVIRLFAMEPKD
jgi:hypothetical protein